MKRSKFSEAQITFVLKQAEDGTSVGEMCRKKSAGLMPSEIRRLRQLEEENAKLKRLTGLRLHLLPGERPPRLLPAAHPMLPDRAVDASFQRRVAILEISGVGHERGSRLDGNRRAEECQQDRGWESTALDAFMREPIGSHRADIYGIESGRFAPLRSSTLS